jgi:hypothetical protein
MRYAFASRMIARGISSTVLAALMGHESSTITERRYVHLFDRQRADEAVRHAMAFPRTLLASTARGCGRMPRFEPSWLERRTPRTERLAEKRRGHARMPEHHQLASATTASLPGTDVAVAVEAAAQLVGGSPERIHCTRTGWALRAAVAVSLASSMSSEPARNSPHRARTPQAGTLLRSLSTGRLSRFRAPRVLPHPPNPMVSRIGRGTDRSKSRALPLRRVRSPPDGAPRRPLLLRL